MTSPYVPNFSHTDWIDNQDRVQAGGPSGFNARFHDLTAEFTSLADVINPLIEALSPAESFLTLMPVLAPRRLPLGAADTEGGWKLVGDSAQKPAGPREAHGIMNVVLPDGAEIKSLKVLGEAGSTSGALPTVRLQRRALDGNTADEIVVAPAFGQEFLPTDEHVVRNRTHRHFITADIAEAPNDVVTLFCFQIMYRTRTN
ncbi:hypothetical protein [Streptomyces sp. NPDC093094]|uniref:hypothetical protein n=1 Tax=Streptomyces sp. NPDC093094 TaxID=3366026 RepID=UPI003827A993